MARSRTGRKLMEHSVKLQRAIKRGAQQGTIKRLSKLMKRGFKRFDREVEKETPK